jgi:hypothetical protein
VKASINGVARFRSTKPTLKAGKRTVTRVKLTARGVRAVRKALARKRSLKVTVRVTAVDAAGNRRTVARAVRIRG